MEKHAIIGAGNLGLDLFAVLKSAGFEVQMFTASRGFRYPTSLQKLVDYFPDVVWDAVGAGSVKEAKENYSRFIDLHVRLPIELVQELPDRCRLITFSTDYVAREEYPGDPKQSVVIPRSLYAQSKLFMEQSLLALSRPKTHIFRIGSLYGSRKPRKCFPHKIKEAYPEPCQVVLPANVVAPTPTAWVAKSLVGRLYSANLPADADRFGPIHHIGPANGCTIAEWASLILGAGYDVKAEGFDDSRPHYSGLGCDFMLEPPTWSELWDEYKETLNA